MPDLAELPAGERIAAGLRDLSHGKTSVDALLVAIASWRLSRLGLELPPAAELPDEPELALYSLFGDLSPDPYSAYGAALRELDSFLSALEARRETARRGAE